MEDLIFELVMDNYRKFCFVFWLGVFKMFVDFSSRDKEILRVSYVSDVVMFVDGYYVGVDFEFF